MPTTDTTPTATATHTPGPWSLEQTNPAFARYHVGTWAANGNFYGIATDLAGEANARLIAAAPDLLCMLRRMMEEYLMRDPSSGPVCALTLEHARAAIAKAEGRA